jgi:tRNA nucleotidyltransferase (CCA-adding enzyme)
MSNKLDIKLPNILNIILDDIISNGYTPVLVGGCMRDYFLNISSKDYDIEVYHIKDILILENILKKYSNVSLVGKSFLVLKLYYEEYEFDFSLPRLDTKISSGHRGFIVKNNSRLDFKNAFKRRDFTINSIGYDIRNNKIIDEYNGLIDLNNRVLKHIDDTTFIEDPLRVYRSVQFCSRFDLKLYDKTLNLCINMVKNNQLLELSKYRIFEEWKKLLLKSNKPSIGLFLLNELYILEHYPYLKNLLNSKLNNKYYLYITKFDNILISCDNIATLNINNDYKKLLFMFSIICNDLTSFEIKSFINSLTNNKKFIDDILLLVKYKLDLLHFYKQIITNEYIKRLSLLFNIEQFCQIQKIRFEILENDIKRKSFKNIDLLINKAKYLNIYNKSFNFLLRGSDLLDIGFNEGPHFKEILLYSNDLELVHDNISKIELIEYIKTKFNHFL